MKSLEEQVRDAFSEVTLPPEVRARTLCALDALQSNAAPEVGTTLKQHPEAGAIPKPHDPEVARAAAQPATTSPSATPRPRVVAWRRTLVACAACFLLVAAGLFGSRAYFEETAYIDIDINPSITLGLNRFDRVVSATPLNEDAKAILENVQLVGKSYGEAITTLTASTAFAPYIKETAVMEINVTAQSEQQQAKLFEQSDSHLSTLPCQSTCHTATTDTREEASAAGMGVGRYRAALELLECDSSLTIKDCESMSMRELRDRKAACESGHSQTDDTEGSASSGGHGNGKGEGRGQGSASGHGKHRSGNTAS